LFFLHGFNCWGILGIRHWSSPLSSASMKAPGWSEVPAAGRFRSCVKRLERSHCWKFASWAGAWTAFTQSGHAKYEDRRSNPK